MAPVKKNVLEWVRNSDSNESLKESSSVTNKYNSWHLLSPFFQLLLMILSNTVSSSYIFCKIKVKRCIRNMSFLHTDQKLDTQTQCMQRLNMMMSRPQWLLTMWPSTISRECVCVFCLQPWPTNPEETWLFHVIVNHSLKPFKERGSADWCLYALFTSQHLVDNIFTSYCKKQAKTLHLTQLEDICK